VYVASDALPAASAPEATIAIAAGVISVPGKPDLGEQPLMTVLVPSLTAAMAAVDPTRHHRFRLYLAYDAGDGVYDIKASNRKAAARAATEAAAPAVELTTHWVRCTNCAGKPSWAHDRAACAAFVEGADYVFRVNDDTVLPAAPGWDAALVDDLARRRPVPNLGVAGPDFDFPVYTPVLSHDFTHWTHVAVHGYYYPPTLPNWSADDWITYVYDRYNATHKLPGVRTDRYKGDRGLWCTAPPGGRAPQNAPWPAAPPAFAVSPRPGAGVVRPPTDRHYSTT